MSQSKVIRDKAELYDLEYDEDFYGDLDYLHKYASKCSRSILELGAGTGRIGFFLLRNGFDVTMVDSDEHMIEVARSKLEHLGVTHNKAHIVHGSMVEYRNPGAFDLILVVGNTFTSLLTQAEQLNVLNNIKTSLADKGTAIIHIYTPDHNSELLSDFGFTHRFKDPKGDLTYDRYVKVNVDRNGEYLEYDFFYKVYDGTTMVDEFCNSVTTRIVRHEDMEHLIASVGMNIVTVSDDFKDMAAEEDTPSRVYVINKSQRDMESQ